MGPCDAVAFCFLLMCEEINRKVVYYRSFAGLALGCRGCSDTPLQSVSGHRPNVAHNLPNGARHLRTQITTSASVSYLGTTAQVCPNRNLREDGKSKGDPLGRTGAYGSKVLSHFGKTRRTDVPRYANVEILTSLLRKRNFCKPTLRLRWPYV